MRQSALHFKKRAPLRVSLEIGVFAFGEDSHPLRLASQHADLRVGNATPTYRVCRSGLHLQKSHLLHCYRLTSPRMAIYRHRRYAQSANFAFGEGRLFLNISGLVSLIPFQNKKPTARVGSLFWQRNRDSNPNIQSQSLLCYRYTIPLSLFSLIIVSQRF